MRRKFIELFAGIGLVRLGLEPCGWQCVFANDIDPKKEEAYRLNFPDNHFLLDDIWKIKPSSLPTPVDLITASFPCVDLSLAGNRAGLEGEESGTFWALVKILQGLKRSACLPPALMIENVTGFLTSAGGKDFCEAIRALSRLGYYCDAFVLDAKFFTPQSRPRLFVIAFQPDLASVNMVKPFGKKGNLFAGVARLEQPGRPKKLTELMYNNQDLNWGLLDLPHPPHLKDSLADVLEDLDDSDPRWWVEDQVGKLLSQMSPLHKKEVARLKKKNSPSFGTVYRRVRLGKTRAELRTDGVAGCLRTPRGGSSKQIVVKVTGTRISARWMTPREYARLQGVEDTFALPQNDIQAYFGLGDAVCVPAITWIAKNLITPAFENLENGFEQDEEPLQAVAN